ncbi:pseudaminic acid biosynthesis-associated methylase [Desulfonauticus submarinus]|uniref:Pseudaminic acid biosynthesis-associated methylase n=1 Tax=Desulfonauticus submarinus TaxID=206665 RepID=A0A1H0BG32_9BACT|nr:pseudaminic acid biosynthesis-associated methylase [Desulfonauticus submarinus]SDN44624.1 pseudaminic acid biosynthesis-associated methylase [Desulfonauticus submarinus]
MDRKFTEQELFWKGKFGDDYSLRNRDYLRIASNISLFSRILRHTINVKSVLELGANIGLNLMALRYLIPELEMGAVEINEKAALELKNNIPSAEIYVSSILDIAFDKKWDLTFTKGVLIHINPNKLKIVYNLLYHSSRRYILICEYYNPTPVEVVYRGHRNKLFKRDFAGEMLDLYNDLFLIDYGFVYHRDEYFPQDDMNWFLLEKKDGRDNG